MTTKTTTTTHDTTTSPLPWRMQYGQRRKGAVQRFRIIDAQYQPVAEVCRTAAHYPGGRTVAERMDENAELIIRAVNSHYDLLAALRELQGWWETSQIGATMSAMGQQADYHKALRMARAAIDKAERGVE